MFILLIVFPTIWMIITTFIYYLVVSIFNKLTVLSRTSKHFFFNYLTSFKKNRFPSFISINTQRALLLKKPRTPRRIWRKKRSTHWFEHIVRNAFDDGDYIENFRMSKVTFHMLCEFLRAELTPKVNFLSKFEPLSVEKQVALSLYFLASCCEYRVVGNQFGIHKSTVCVCIYRFVKAVNTILGKKYIKMPNAREARIIANSFEEVSGIPNIIGCIDGTHIPILPPKDGYRDFINRKGWASLVLQGVVDHQYKFMDISIKTPGSCHDAAVFANSTLYKNSEQMMPQGGVNVNNQNIPYVIIGDPAYPLLPWILKAYINRQNHRLTEFEDNFNVRMNSARVNVEIAFGHLKARWRTLLKRIDVAYCFVPQLVATCCILHNFLESQKETFRDKWLTEVEEVEQIYPQPEHFINRQFNDFTGSTIRDHLCNYLAQNFPLRSSLLL